MPIKLLILVLFIGTISTTVLILLFGEEDDRRAGMRPSVWAALVLVSLVAAGGIGWEELTLRKLARSEGGEITGLIARPVPLTTDHRYTEHGREYLYRAIQVPTVVTWVLIVVAAVIGSAMLYARDLRRMIVAVWLHAVTAVLAVGVYAAWRFLQAIDLFI